MKKLYIMLILSTFYHYPVYSNEHAFRDLFMLVKEKTQLFIEKLNELDAEEIDENFEDDPWHDYSTIFKLVLFDTLTQT